MSKLNKEELDLWIKNCLIVLAGLLPEIPSNLLRTRRPRKPEEHPQSFDWWLYQAFTGSCPRPLAFSGTLQAFVEGVQCSPYKLLFGFQNDDDLDVDDDFIKEDLVDVFTEHLTRLLQVQKKLQKEDEEPKLLVCPECGSKQITTEHHQKFMVNTGKHYCHSMKTQDHDSPATCLTCDWTGERHQLVTVPVEAQPHNRYCAAGMCVATDASHSPNCPTRKGISYHGKPKTQDPSGQ